MVQTRLDVCNLSIGRIGGETIDAIDETTPAGAYCATQYDQCRDWLLGKYRWSFANAVKSLGPRAVLPPDCPGTYAFDPPADLIGAIHSHRTAADPAQASPVRVTWANGYMAAAGNVLVVEYTRRVPEDLWPVWFVELVKTVFAAGMASAVGQNNALAAQLYQTAFGTPAEAGEGGLYAQARNEDSRNAPSRKAFGGIDDGPLVGARFGTGLWPGGQGAYGFPFVGIPGSFGPPTFIDFPEGG